MSEGTQPIETVIPGQLVAAEAEPCCARHLDEEWRGTTAARRVRVATVFDEASKLLTKAAEQAATIDDLVKVANAWRDLAYIG